MKAMPNNADFPLRLKTVLRLVTLKILFVIVHFQLNVYFQKLFSRKKIQKLQQEFNLKRYIKLWKIIKSINFFKNNDYAADLCISLFSLVNRPEIFAQVDLLSELFQIQENINSVYYQNVLPRNPASFE